MALVLHWPLYGPVVSAFLWPLCSHDPYAPMHDHHVPMAFVFSMPLCVAPMATVQGTSDKRSQQMLLMLMILPSVGDCDAGGNC